jgi:isopenicillin-N N-acyltransferase like protein
MIPQFSLKGRPKEIGFQHGTQCRDMIQKNIGLYFRLFQHYSNLNRDQVFKVARRFLPVLESFDPAILEEIKGIAEGARAGLEEILALNARTELMYPGDRPEGGECTAIAVLPEASASGEMLLAQNWDWKPELMETVVLLEIAQPGKPNIVTLTEAGVVAKIGLNSAGVATCLNVLKSKMGRIGVPIHVLLRAILNCERLGDAIARIAAMDRGSANNCLLAHRDGMAMDFELGPQALDFFYPEDGLLFHTNHFISERMKPIESALTEFPDSILRLGRARQKLTPRAGKISPDDLKELFQDHFNHPDAICRHPDERDPEQERVQTVASIIMNLTTREVEISHGPPCGHEYRRLTFSSL